MSYDFPLLATGDRFILLPPTVDSERFPPPPGVALNRLSRTELSLPLLSRDGTTEGCLLCSVKIVE